ncbi:ABC-type branched-chain amino acid transport system, substrate-binding protein [Variovorax sp. OK605]|jgi:branched-chain amino acid transport system substrate-binding protein|uniref:ABC transporter substrate-binding protein n=1 Tax=unclassified Variovorax TaxID=663243 RepID=UPI0008BFA537|nr:MULTISPECIES: ABC transporter substrate-binding protein [unclassified Variovorax]SEJ88708.1 ABC-type branched-chain amino acid transport system, substrate-binding protein [Variovorax sp. OK202]SFD05076.1 amino acid/amide ABC transporter substrate-binding protein, HAAT family [Variovorax sp. OK212]SFP13586.1 ABC-type branched-chain amino acid transport system, substrate-binding protein [Variovorax sp. OK605]
MTMNRRHFSLAAGAAALGGFGIARAQGDTPLVLGQSAPFTGPAAQLGVQFHQGAKLFLDQYNAQPGRRNVVIKNLDDGYEPDRCAANTQKLIDEDVFALFGYVGTPTSLAALPLAVKDRVPFIAPLTGAMSLREPFQKNVFHLRASYNDETALMVKQLTHLGLKKIAVFYQNDAYGKAGLDGVTQALEQQQLKPVALGTVERNSSDVAQAVKNIMDARPDAVVQVGAYKACATFIREARKAGFGGTFFNLSFVGTQALSDELGKDASGVMVTQVMPSPFNPANALAREFTEAVRKAGNGATANFSGIEGYLAAKVLTEGLRKAPGKPTRESLIAGLESIDRQPFGGFEVSFSPKSHVASKFVELSMLTGDGKVRT